MSKEKNNILTPEELFESGSMLTRDHEGHEQFLMNKGTFISLIQSRDKLLKETAIKEFIEKNKPKKNIWGADIKESDDFFDRITKNAGPRD